MSLPSTFCLTSGAQANLGSVAIHLDFLTALIDGCDLNSTAYDYSSLPACLLVSPSSAATPKEVASKSAPRR